MDIEDRAERWAREYASEHDISDHGPGTDHLMITAYLAGSAQTQRDYAAHCAATCPARPGRAISAAY